MRFWLLALFVGLAACDGDEDAATPPGDDCADCGAPSYPTCAPGSMLPFATAECVPVGWHDCPSGFVPDASGWGCHDRTPQEACAPGTMTSLGADSCVDVGDRSCAEGFERDPSGWGCRAILPTEPCTGARRAALGHTECVQVGSCDGAFPPADATLFVDDDYADSELDDTHFRTIHEALNVAVDGTTIAVEAGTYVGGLQVYTQVSIVGRCAAKVIVDAEGAFTSGVWVSSASLSVRGMTLFRPELGFYVNTNGTSQVTATDVVIDEARGWGVYLPGSFDNDGVPTQVVLDGVVVRNTRMSGEGSQDGGIAIYVETGSQVEVRNSELAGNLSAGLAALYGGMATVRGTVIRDNLGEGWIAGGVYASESSVVQVHESALVDNAPYASWTLGNNAQLYLHDSVVGRPGESDAPMLAGTGAAVSLGDTTVHSNPSAFFDGGSTGNLNSSTLRGFQLTWGPSSVNMTSSAVVDGAVRVYGTGSALSAQQSVFTGNGESAPAIHADSGALITLNASAIERFEGNGLVLLGASIANLGSSVVRDVVIDDATALYSGYRGAIAVAGGAQLTLNGSAVAEAAPYGIEVRSDRVSSSVLLQDSLVRDTRAADGAPTLPAGIRLGGTSSLQLLESGLYDNEGHALLADGTAVVNVQLSVVARNRGSEEVDGTAMWIGGGANATLFQSAFAGNVGVGLAAVDFGLVVATDTMFTDNRAATAGKARALVASDGGRLELTRTNVIGNDEVGMEVAGSGAVLRLTDGMVGLSSRGTTSDLGHGAIALPGGELHLTRVRFFGAEGVAAGFFGGGGSLQVSILDHNARAVHVQGTTLVPEGPGSSTTFFLEQNNRFIRNDAEVTRDVLEVPSAFAGEM